jgi:MFS family permease
MNSAGRRRLTLVAMCIAQGMILLDVTIVNVALPSIQRELHESSGELEWVISAYALSLAALIPLSGSLGDRFGRKRFFAAGMVVFALGSMACALSSSAVELMQVMPSLGEPRAEEAAGRSGSYRESSPDRVSSIQPACKAPR